MSNLLLVPSKAKLLSQFSCDAGCLYMHGELLHVSLVD